MFVEFGVLACSALGSRRRSRFYIRLSCARLVMLAAALGLAFAINFSALLQRAVGPAWLALSLGALPWRPCSATTPSPLRGLVRGRRRRWGRFRSATACTGPTSRRRSAPGPRPSSGAQARSQPAEHAWCQPAAAGSRAGAAPRTDRPRPPIAEPLASISTGPEAAVPDHQRAGSAGSCARRWRAPPITSVLRFAQ
jgi:hypothetical protein